MCEIHTINSDRLIEVVDLLSQHKDTIDDYFYHEIFNPYDIEIEKCITNFKIEDTKRLFDFSYTTRQGGQSNESIELHQQNEDCIIETLERILEIIVSEENVEKSHYSCLYLLNRMCKERAPQLKGIGQKISTMFLKFLIYYSEDFPIKGRLLRELFIPLDIHVLKLLFKSVNGNPHNRLNLYEGNICTSNLQYTFSKDEAENISLKENNITRIQNNICSDFDSLNIEQPPIILDYLWYVGRTYCSMRLSDVGCGICFLRGVCDQPQSNA